MASCVPGSPFPSIYLLPTIHPTSSVHIRLSFVSVEVELYSIVGVDANVSRILWKDVINGNMFHVDGFSRSVLCSIKLFTNRI